MDTPFSMYQVGAEALLPPRDISVSQWADENVVLTGSGSAERGQWHTRPYQREPMDVLSPSHPCKQVVLMSAAQMLKTSIMVNFLGYIADVDPGPHLELIAVERLDVVDRDLRPGLTHPALPARQSLGAAVHGLQGVHRGGGGGVQVGHVVTHHPGGQGAGRDAIDFILGAQGKLDSAIETFLDAENPAASGADIGTGKDVGAPGA